MFRGVGDSAGKCIFNLLKAFNLCERKSVVKRITIVKTRVNGEVGDSGGSRKAKSMTDVTEIRNVVMASTKKGGNLFGKR